MDATTGIDGAPIQVRDIPAMRVASLPYQGAAAEVGEAFGVLERWVADRGLFAAGPLVAAFDALPEGATGVCAELRMPLTRLPPSEDGVVCRRVPSERCACVLFDGAMDARFRAVHDRLLAWVDARGFQRGEAVHHAYIRTGRGVGEWTVEIRVPLGSKRRTLLGP